jgi:hypothetical protein
MTEHECPTCNSVTTFDILGLADVDGLVVMKCTHCEQKLTVPESVDGSVTQSSPMRVGDSVTPSNGDYSTLLTLGKVNSFLGWVGVVLGVIILARAIFSGDGLLTGVFTGIGVMLLGLLVVAFGQIISCFVDTERHTKASSEHSRTSSDTLKQILDKMTVLVERDESGRA